MVISELHSTALLAPLHLPAVPRMQREGSLPLAGCPEPVRALKSATATPALALALAKGSQNAAQERTTHLAYARNHTEKCL